MKKQGLKVTIGQLRRVADELEKELLKTYEEANCSYPTYSATNQQLHQINIINIENQSDTWEIEE